MSARVAIVGGGLAGLATAYYLRAAIPDPAQLEILGLEGSPRLGGPLWTERQQGFLIEQGADSFLTTRRSALDLVRELGLGDQVIGVPPDRRRTYVWHGGRLVPLPTGLRLLATPRPGPLLRSPLLSARGRLRVLGDLVRRPGPATPDESLASFVRRRLGEEMLERIAEPMVAAIHAGEAERLSMEALLPQFRAYERDHGSVIRGLRAETHRPSPDRTQVPTPFASFAEGMGTLPDRLADRTPSVEWRLDTIVEAVERTGSRFDVVPRDGPTVRADVLVLAVSPGAAADLLRPVHAGLSEALRSIPSSSSAVLTLAFPEDLVRPLDGTGLLVPRQEGVRLRACTWSSSKFPGRAPSGHVLVRAFYGGAADADVLTRTDADLASLAIDELTPILNVRGPPEFVRVRRWPAAHPQYEVGHLERVRAIEDLQATVPGLVLTGSGYRGIGISDCVVQARRVAEQAHAVLRDAMPSPPVAV